MSLTDPHTQNQLMTAGKAAGDIASAGIVVGTLANVLPAIAAALTIVWTVIRIYETQTVQRWLGKDADR